MRSILVINVAVVVGLVGPTAARAEEATNPCADKTAVGAKIENLIVNGEYNPKRAGLGDTITLEVDDAGLARLRARATCRKQGLALFLDGWRVKGLVQLPAADARHRVGFALDRNEDNKDLWGRMLADELLRGRRALHVTIGTEDGEDVADEKQTPLELRAVVTWKAVTAGVIFAIAALILLWQGRYGSMLRDSGKTASGEPATYSLARVQMSWWMIVILFSILFVWSLTGEVQPLTPTLLGLMGIASGTALGAAVIDANKQALAKPDPAAPQPAPWPSRGLLNDIMTDANGYSFHRVQMVIWTLFASAIFIGTMIATLSLPNIDGTYLALLGISSGTYLGFKLPEKT
jgi:hypothetical protein